MRSLCTLPGGIGRFVPCEIGANQCRLRHVGWEKCGHGLTSSLWETASERNWFRADPLVHPKKWLRPDVVLPASFSQCKHHLTPGGFWGAC